MGKKQVIDYVMNSPANTNKAVLEGMLDGMGGADVPAPTAEDTGKVLGVNESGSYALVEQSGGGDLMVVGVVMPDPYTKKIDKDYEEVKAAVLANKPVLFTGIHQSVWFAISYDFRIDKLRTYSVQINITDGTFYKINNFVIDTDGTITIES